MTISEPHSPIFDAAEDLERRWDAGVESIVAAATQRPLHVYSEGGSWWWGWRGGNWVAPQPPCTQPASFTRAEMHWDVAHAGPFNRNTL